MDNENKEKINVDEKAEEVVFSGISVNKEEKPARIKLGKADDISLGAVSENSEKREEEPDDDGVVFAAATRSPSVTKIAQQKSVDPKRRGKKKGLSPVVPMSIVTVLVLGAIAGGVYFAINSTRNGVNLASSASSGNASQASEESKNAGASGGEESVNTLPVIREESADIKTINTSTITFGKNVSVCGVNLEGKTLTQAYDALQGKVKELRDDIEITVNCDSKTIKLTEDDFKFDTDLSSALIQAYHFSRGELDNPTIESTESNGVHDFKVTSVVNKNSINDAVKKVAKKFDVQPQDAHVKAFTPKERDKFTYADGKDGYLVSQRVVTEEITQILSQSDKTGSFNVTAVRTPYKHTLADVKANTTLISSNYTTANNVYASVHNMELAIETCNGYVVKPGETFSFNKMTGDTTVGDLGYLPSTAIVEGRYEQQYGGGICQASTTIYVAAIKADMTILERHAHMYASVYEVRGLDATVDYGNLDMRFRNDKEYPVYIATYVYDYNGDGLDELCVEFYGPTSTEYDEIVPVGWVNYIGSGSYSAKGAKVYMKDGKEVKREYLPEGTYDFHGDSYYTVENLMPSDPEYGPKEVSPTGKTPTILSPSGIGVGAPIPYGTASEYLKQANSENSRKQEQKPTTSQTTSN